MKTKTFATVLLLLACTIGHAQLSLKTEYFGKSSYRDENNQKVGNSKGAAVVYQGSMNVPFMQKINGSNQPTIWGIGISGAYVKLNNENFTDDLVLPQIMNLQLALFHIRPISEKWSIMANVGAGIYTPDTKFSKIRIRNLLGNVGLIFIRHFKPNIEIGGGLAFNNTFGYPMLFSAIYFSWDYNKQFICKISALDGLNLLLGYKLNDFTSLNFITEMNGQMALTKKDNKEKIFTHQYIVVGLRPSINISDKISIPITVGFNAMRAAYYDNRNIKALFQSMSREYDPCFQISPYLSASVEINF
ncbi:DUF6268 family outer membrane beta-barrel protein [Bacteroides fragilis]